MLEMVRVKICGLTNLSDALMVAEAGADALGFVLVRGSPRYIAPRELREIRRHLPPFVSVVGVFANAPLQEVREISEACHLSLVQLHGEEDPDYCSALGEGVIKAFRIRDKRSLSSLEGYRVKAILLDSYRPGKLGGTGTCFDWSLALEAKRYGHLILSGGLTPENVGKAIGTVRPYAVDVSSGVEEFVGKKDQRKVRMFLEEVARAGRD
jgi:phosphoribosylanthranilate isomerase